jgi:hypothetical protein
MPLGHLNGTYKRLATKNLVKNNMSLLMRKEHVLSFWKTPFPIQDRGEK